MPITTCPVCNSYVTVPNVQTSAPFQCPYCIKKQRLVLYKCFSCMKVSIFRETAMPSACPKCRTLVRSAKPLALHFNPLAIPFKVVQFQPLVVPFVEKDWLYHVTPNAVADSIRKIGLCSTLLRTGKCEPDATGSFALDRVNRIDKKTKELVLKYVTLCRMSVPSPKLDGIELPPPKINFQATGDQLDYERLKELEKAAFVTFAKKVNPKYVYKVTNYKKLSQEIKTTQLVEYVLKNPNHYLMVLAVQVAEHDFSVEGMITAQHVYFLNTEVEKTILTGMADYTKLRLPGSYVILRVLRAKVAGLEQDMADARAVRTRQAVPGNLFEVMCNTQNPAVDFKKAFFRSDQKNWKPL